MYLAKKIDPTGKDLTVPGIVKLNKRWGRRIVTDQLRYVHGFVDVNEIGSRYAYVNARCEQVTMEEEAKAS